MTTPQPTTTDRYEAQRIFCKNYSDVAKSVHTSLKKATQSLCEFMSAMDGLQVNYDKMIQLGWCTKPHPTLDMLTSHMGQYISTWRTEVFPKLDRLVNEECLAGFPTLHPEVHRLEQLRQERRKLVETYDYHRKEVLSKEAEYLKKKKPLTESLTYTAMMKKMEDSQVSFESVAHHFDVEMSNLLKSKDLVCAHTLQCSLEHFSGVMGVMYTQMDRLFQMTAKNTHLVEASSSANKRRSPGRVE